MKLLKQLLIFILTLLPLFLYSQANPLLKKYAGTYYRLSYSEETPVATSEKVILTADGKLASTYFPFDDNGAVAKTPEKRTGTWKATEGVIKVTISGVDASTKEQYSFDEDYRFEDGLFIGDNNKLVKMLVSNPAFLTKYAGSYNLIDFSREITDHTPTIILKADGTCAQSTPFVDNSGTLTKTPVINRGTWKANDGIIQLTLKENDEERIIEYKMKDGLFTDRQGYELKKVVPPPPQGLYLKKYAGTYNVLVDGEMTDNKYALNADGTGAWTFAKGQPAVKGTWKSSEGIMQLFFYPEGEGEKGGEMITDYKFQDGAFRAESGLSLKKVVPTTQTKK